MVLEKVIMSPTHGCMIGWMRELSPDSAKAVGSDAKRKARFQGRAGSVAQNENGGEQGEAPRDDAFARDATAATTDAFGFGVLFFGVFGLFFSLVQGPAPAADAVGGRLCLSHFERRSSENRVVETVLSIRPSHHPR